MRIVPRNLIFTITLLLSIHIAYGSDISEVELTGIGNHRIVKIQFSGDAVLPQESTNINSQITLNFPGVKSLVKPNILKYNDSILSNITLSDAGVATQVMVTMKQPSSYRFTKKENTIWLYIDPETNQVHEASNKQHTDKTSVHDHHKNDQNPISVDFRKNHDGQGSIILMVNKHNQPQVKRSNHQVQIVLKNYKPAVKDQKTYDVTEFNTTVKDINVTRQGNDALIAIKLDQSGFDYRISNNESQIIVDVDDKKNFMLVDDRSQPVTKYEGGKISLDFQNMDVRTVLQILAKEAGVNIIVNDLVQGKLTLKLENVRWDEALDVVLQSNNLGKKTIGSIINIMPKSMLESQYHMDLAQENKEVKLGKLRTYFFEIKYKNVADVKKMIDASQESSGSILSSRGSVMIDTSTNIMIVTDIPANISKIEQVLKQIDIPSDQVVVSARIVEVKDSYARNLGMQLGISTTPRNGYSFGGVKVTNSSKKQEEGKNDIISPNINFPISTSLTNSFGGFSLVKSSDSAIISLTIAALQAEDKAKVVSSPRVLTLNGEEATLEDGTDIPYQVDNGKDSAKTVQFKRAVTSLKVTPNITSDGNVILNVVITKDSPMGGDAVSVKTLKTKAMVEDGGTLILGGIYDESSDNNENKVPLLGDLPIIGNVFKVKRKTTNRREVLIFLTPKIVRSSESLVKY